MSSMLITATVFGVNDLCRTELVRHNKGGAGPQVRPVGTQAPHRSRPRPACDPHRCLHPYPSTDDLDARIEWIGADDRGVELEIIAVELPDLWLVIHVMPTALKRKP